ncbi:MAG: O-methyltransferase [Clostridia bacterium]|nr:O-methyltransferase [Clostridia bacterium]
MINEYTTRLTRENLNSNIPNELLSLRNEYREKGVPTILTDGLNELLLTLKMKNPSKILELGTATGISGTAMLLSLKNATLVTVEKYPEMQNEAIKNFDKFKVADRVTTILGDAIEVLQNLNEKFDFVFLDCNKSAYYKAYPYIKNLLNEGGVLFADNVLFRGYLSGEVETPKKYKSLVNNIKKFNDMVSADEDMVTCFFDVGDGISVSVKK